MSCSHVLLDGYSHSNAQHCYMLQQNTTHSNRFRQDLNEAGDPEIQSALIDSLRSRHGRRIACRAVSLAGQRGER
jgi:hypothetical protein